MPISDIDIWRTAQQMIEQHGKSAGVEAALRSNRALEVHDRTNYETWQRVAMAIGDLQRRSKVPGESVH